MTLALHAITLALPDRTLLGPLDLSIDPGTIATVMGPSGCGKSSLLALVAGTLGAPFRWSGAITLSGVAVDTLPVERRRIGLLFQDALLFPHLTVGENIGFGLPASLRGSARRDAISALLDAVELPDLASRDPTTLSGGQAARVALARTLAAEPLAVLLDEPFSRLDARLREDMRRFTFARIAARGIPALLVTHDPADAAAAAGPIIDLDATALR